LLRQKRLKALFASPARTIAVPRETTDLSTIACG
jgi:hypothetical protein